MWTRNPVRAKRFSGAPTAYVPPSTRMSTRPKTYWPPGCWRCQPVETTRSLRATGNPRSRNQQETARNYCSNPHNGLESGGLIPPEDVNPPVRATWLAASLSYTSQFSVTLIDLLTTTVISRRCLPSSTQKVLVCCCG